MSSEGANGNSVLAEKIQNVAEGAVTEVWEDPRVPNSAGIIALMDHKRMLANDGYKEVSLFNA